MCPHSHHTLATNDLNPVISWLSLRGRCRYCGEQITKQYPLVELVTALLVVATYAWWPVDFEGIQIALLSVWLVILTGLMALLVYDARWYILPDRVMKPLAYLAATYALLSVFAADSAPKALLNIILAVLVGGGVFYILFQVSNGKWIGGGDVKLGWLLGLIAGTPGRSILFIFLAALIGTLFSLPLLLTHRLKRSSVVPFGPFLIIALIIVQLFGHDILNWYQQTFFPYWV
jgi:prepilin signal peptidase PulO-like enzyme (type II secretory pathway)